MSRYMKYWLVLFVLLAGIYTKGSAQNIQVNATLDAKDSIGFPTLPDSISDKIQVLSSKADTTFDKNDVSIETIRKSYVVTAFDSGEYVIPAYSFKTANGILKTDSLVLQVHTIAVDTTKGVYDIKQPLAVKYSVIDWLRDNRGVVGGSLLGLLVIAGIAYYLLTRPKKEVVIEEVKPVTPTHVIALQKLNELRSKNLWQQEQTKQYYIELSDVIREYLEQRYNIAALEQTSEEIFTSLKYMDIASENRNLLRQVLILSDLVKFAKEKPAGFENEKSIDNAISFITGTQAVQQVDIKADDKK